MKRLITLLKSWQKNLQPEALMNEFPMLVFQVNREGRLMDFYAADSRLLAVPADQVIGSFIPGLFSVDESARIMDVIRQALNTRTSQVLVYSMKIPSGVRQFEATIVPDEGDHAFAFIRDVTDVQLLYDAAATQRRIIDESERRFRLLAENLPGVVYLCNNDADFSMQYINEKVRTITGYKAEEFLAKRINFPQLYHPEDAPLIYSSVENALRGKTSFHLQYRIRHADGSERWIEEFGAGVYHGDRLEYLEGYLQDITERKKSEEKILLQNEALSKANDELDRFVYSASHDLRSPLSSLRGLINITSRIQDRAELENIFSMMQKRIQSMEHFIKEITFYSQNARLDVERSAIDLHSVVTDSIDELRYADEAAGILFDVRIPPGVSLLTDSRRLKIVLHNLIGNAIKYSDPAKGQRWVRLSCVPMSDTLEIAVSDNGLGIPDELQPRIFDMFFRASERSSGSGLGLYIVKETLTRLQGTIEVTSTLGTGSTFKVVLPN